MNDQLVFVSSSAPARAPAADPRKVVPRSCPGLSITPTTVTWIDSRGQAHDLLREKRYSPGDAARIMGRSCEWILRRIRSGDLYPVAKYNARTIEIWQASLEDYVVRNVGGGAL